MGKLQEYVGPHDLDEELELTVRDRSKAARGGQIADPAEEPALMPDTPLLAAWRSFG